MVTTTTINMNIKISTNSNNIIKQIQMHKYLFN